MNKRSTSNADIWRTCLHEAAHVVVARALNYWNCTASACVNLIEGNGAAVYCWGMTKTVEAIANASGDYGVRLSRVFPAPRHRPRHLPDASTTTGKRAQAIREIQSEAATVLHREAVASGTDAERVARYSISFDPTTPRDWQQRFRRIHAQARLEVWRHRHEIRAVASILFREGEIVIPGDPEHEAFFCRLHGAASSEENRKQEEK